MKKTIILLIFLLIMSGCQKKEEIILPESLSLSIDKIDMYSCDKWVKVSYSVTPINAKIDDFKWISSNKNVATVKNGYIKGINDGECIITYGNETINQSINVKVTYSRYYIEAPKKEDIEGLTYVNDILVVNKSYSLPNDYNPNGLIDLVEKAFNQMQYDAKQDGIELTIKSGFRSYDTQDKLYKKYCQKDVPSVVDTYSARPGYSEHQSGLALDLNKIDDLFYQTDEYKWLDENAQYYGFILRYPKDKESITGYKYEPWHFRFVGTKLAMDIKKSGLCLEEYLNIDSKYK